MRSSSICSAARSARQARWVRRGLAGLACLACLACVACAGGASGAVGQMADLTNPFLGPDYSAWLIGPVARIAKPEEIKAYLALRDDGQAAAFVQQFWERRNPNPGTPNALLARFEDRAEVADKKYSEAGLLGRRTDRGTILILYGPPAKGAFEVAKRPTDPPIEVWQYGATAPAGLDGKRPDTFYRFTKRGDLTVLYIPRPGTVPLTAAPPP
ncbi:MAG TPA: GWxTD domain-containing protein [Thermoanaerobaculia bacterium]|nr:GWxTD domain-containing protein [Thermoanaerobaculia bacterium]